MLEGRSMAASQDQCPVCGAPRAAAEEVCARCSWDFAPVLPSDSHRYEERLRQAQKVWQAAVAYHAAETGHARAAGRSVSMVAHPVAVESAQETFTNSLGMEFILIAAGVFTMGDGGRGEAYRVTISRPFYLGKYQVTQAQWVAVMGSNPSHFKGERNPVENVSWNDAQTFIQRLNEQEDTGKYRLPTEAEWEYAARAGATSAYSFGNNPGQLIRCAWFKDNSDKQTHPVGELQPNAWGLYDMHGNVWEWVNDWYGIYPASAVADPCGPSSGDSRVLRGGSWLNDAWYLRSASRCFYAPDYCLERFGFRLALYPDKGH
jgi:formylglycine-generating enzyme required for sulfatase activity